MLDAAYSILNDKKRQNIYVNFESPLYACLIVLLVVGILFLLALLQP